MLPSLMTWVWTSGPTRWGGRREPIPMNCLLISMCICTMPQCIYVAHIYTQWRNNCNKHLEKSDRKSRAAMSEKQPGDPHRWGTTPEQDTRDHSLPPCTESSTLKGYRPLCSSPWGWGHTLNATRKRTEWTMWLSFSFQQLAAMIAFSAYNRTNGWSVKACQRAPCLEAFRLFASGQPTWTEIAWAAVGCFSESEAVERHSRD